MAAEIYAAPDTAQRRTARRLAMVLGVELTAANMLRESYAARLRSESCQSPAVWLSCLRDLAQLDGRRRALRELLADQLESTA